MFPSLRVARDLWRWLGRSQLLSVRSASTQHRRKGKKPTEWTREEVSERLSGLEQQVDSGETPHPKHLALLLPPIRHLKNQDDLSRILQVVRRSKVTLDEVLGSALVSSLAEGGRVADVQEIVQQMQGRLRVQSQSSVLEMACREGNSDLALEILRGRQSTQPLPPSLVGLLLELSHETSRSELVEQLLTVLRETRQHLSMEGVAQLKEWARSQSQPYTCELATVNSKGVCGVCEGQLEKALSEETHQHLLKAVTEAVHSEGLGFSPELISNLSRLRQRLSATPTPYRVVVDGLNISRVSSKNFSAMQVMDIVNQLTETVGGPVLVVARKHLAKEMDQLPSFYSSVPRSHDFHVFTTHINEISDDICVIYAALTTGRDCYTVSNDHMSDNAAMLGPREAKLFAMWQASRQITLHPIKIQLLYPADHSKLTQRSQSGWHVPISLPSQATPTNDTWLLEGRQSWDDRASHTPQPNWLCLTR